MVARRLGRPCFLTCSLILEFLKGQMKPSTDSQRYTRVAMLLHWLIGLALIGQIVFGLLLDNIAPAGTPARAPIINLHKSVGIVLGVLILLRLAWRLGHQPPPWPRAMTAAQKTAALLGHRVLYACMIVMPLSGYVASNFSKYGVKFFGISLAPWGPASAELYKLFNGVHVVTGWLFGALVAGHIVIAAKHALINRDGVFSRMLP